MKPQLDRRLSILCGCPATLLLLFFPSATLRAAPGDLDPTFGIGGIVINGFGSSLGVSQTAVGKIVVVGDSYIGSYNYDFAIVRYNPDGSLDTSFGNFGIVVTPVGGPATSVAIQ